MRRRRFSLAAIAIVALLFANARDARAAVTYDPNHTSAHFAVKHLTISTVEGAIPIKNVTFAIGPQNVLTSVSATLDAAGVDTGNADRDADLRSPRWFDATASPTMTFTSTKITGDAAAMTVQGTLTIRGVSKPVTLVAKYEGQIKDAKGRTHLGYSATGSVDRTLWGIGSGFPPAVVGYDVTLTLALEAIEG